MPHLQISKLTKRYGEFTALKEITLSVEQGEFMVLLGPSGCGKTTLLRAIAGLEMQDSGSIVHAGRDISRLSPALRDYGIVFQSYALFPNLSVADNIGYGMKNRKTDRRQINRRVDEMLELVGLPGSRDKFPAQLSGGQQQRIALARALATSPDLLLLDEPLSALDAIERVRLRVEIRALQKRLGVTTIMVTHDQEEALAMADRIVVMRGGEIQQIGEPEAIYHTPYNDFVADFIGRGNLIEAKAISNENIRFGSLSLRCGASLKQGQSVRFFVRPEDINLCATGDSRDGSDHSDGGENVFEARVLSSSFLGPYFLVSLEPVANPDQALVAQFSGNYLAGRKISMGDTLKIGIPARHLRPMPEDL